MHDRQSADLSERGDVAGVFDDNTHNFPPLQQPVRLFRIVCGFESQPLRKVPRSGGNGDALQIEVHGATGGVPQVVVITHPRFIIGVIGTRLDYVEIVATQSAAQVGAPTQRHAEVADFYLR